jgi:hypothetical protein
VLTPAPENNGGFGGVSSDAALAASFSPLFGKTLRHQLLTYPASAQTTIWCKKRARGECSPETGPGTLFVHFEEVAWPCFGRKIQPLPLSDLPAVNFYHIFEKNSVIPH